MDHRRHHHHHHHNHHPLNPSNFIESPRYIPFRPPSPFSNNPNPNPNFFPLSPHRHLPRVLPPPPPPPPHHRPPPPPIIRHALPPPPPLRRHDHHRFDHHRHLPFGDDDRDLIRRPLEFPPSPNHPRVSPRPGEGPTFHDARHRFHSPDPPRVLPPDGRAFSNNRDYRPFNLDRISSPGRPFVEVVVDDDDDRFRRHSDAFRNPPMFREDFNYEPLGTRLNPHEFRNRRDDHRVVDKLERDDRRVMGNLERDDRKVVGNFESDERRVVGNFESDDRRFVGNDRRVLGNFESEDDRRVGNFESEDVRRVGNFKCDDRMVVGNFESDDRRVVCNMERDDRRILGNLERVDHHDYHHHEQYHPEVSLGEFELNLEHETLGCPVVDEVPKRCGRDYVMVDENVNVKRGVQPPLRDKSRSPTKLWNRLGDGDDGFREQGVTRGLEFKKYTDRVRRQEHTRSTPRKNFQKKSAFLRIQPLKQANNNNNNNNNNNKNRYDKASSPNKRRKSLEHLDNRLTQVRDGSPVELDVSFKSNALVAKAVIGNNPSSLPIDSNTYLTMSDSDIRIGSENSPKTEGVKNCENNSVSAKKEEHHSVKKVRISPIAKRVGLPSDMEVYPNGSESSFSGSSSLSGVSSRRGSLKGKVDTGHSEKLPMVNGRKRRKSIAHPSCQSGSAPTKVDVKHVNMESSGNQPSSSDNTWVKVTEGMFSYNGPVFGPIDNKAPEETGKIDVDESPIGLEEEVIGHSIPDNPLPKNMSIVEPVPDSLTPSGTECLKNTNVCAEDVLRISNSDENVSNSVEKCNFDTFTVYDTGKDQDIVPLLPDQGSGEGTSEPVPCLGGNVDSNDAHSENVDTCSFACVTDSNLNPVDVSNKAHDKVDLPCTVDSVVKPCEDQVIPSHERGVVERSSESLEFDRGMNERELKNSEVLAICGKSVNNGVHSYKRNTVFDDVDSGKSIASDINATLDFQEQECQGGGTTLVGDEPGEGSSKAFDSLGCALTFSNPEEDISLLNKKGKGTSELDSLDAGISAFCTVSSSVKDSDLPVDRTSSAVSMSFNCTESDVLWRNVLLGKRSVATSSMNDSCCSKKQKIVPLESDSPDALTPESPDISGAANALISMPKVPLDPLKNFTQSAEQDGLPNSVLPGKHGLDGATNSSLTTYGFHDSLTTDYLCVKDFVHADDKQSSLLSNSECKKNKNASLMMTEADDGNGLIALESEGRMTANDQNSGVPHVGSNHLSTDLDTGLVDTDLASPTNDHVICNLPYDSAPSQLCAKYNPDGVATDTNMLDAQLNPTLHISDDVPALSDMGDEQPSGRSLARGPLSSMSDSFLASNKMSGTSVSSDNKSFPQRIMTVPLKNPKKRKSSSNIMNRQMTRRNALTCDNVSLSSTRASPVFTSSTKAPSTYSAKPRTWHRSDSHQTSNAVVKKPFAGTTLPRPPSDKTLNVEGTSYIRKWNSLVRNPASGAATPGHRVIGSSINQSKPNDTDRVCKMGSSGMVDSTIVHDCPSTGGSNTLIERPNTPLSPCSESSDKAPSYNAYTRDCRSSQPAVQHEGTDNDAALKSSDTMLNISEYPQGVGNRNSEDVGELSDENLPTSSAKRIVYIKRKSNQLIATSNSVDSVLKIDDTAALASDNGYYKKKKNQLIRASSESNIQQMLAVIDDNPNSHTQRASTGYSGRSSAKRQSSRVKPRKISLVWKLGDKKSSGKGVDLLGCGEILSHLLPWKRASYWRSVWRSSAHISNNSSSMKNRKLPTTKKRAIIYVRSGRGFSLRRSKVVSVAGSSLKWSKSMEKRSKKVSEEAAAAVAAMDSAERQQAGASSVCGTEGRKLSSHKSGERIFRIGAFRYSMDPSRRTLQRIPDEEASNSVVSEPAKDVRRTYVPKRLLIGADEYVRIGNGNQLVRDPKRRTRILASEKIRWSVHTARMRLARKRKFCLFFTRFGKCNKGEGKCPFIHDSSKIAVCTKFLNGLCRDPKCKLTHKVIPERMPDCSFFLQGLCSNENCPYRHVNVNPKASICESFLRGYCAAGNECQKKHRYICPEFEATSSCPRGSKCKLYHPKKNKGKKRKTSKDQTNSRGRYFGSGLPIIAEPEAGMTEKYIAAKNDGFSFQGDMGDYMCVDVSGDEPEENNDPMTLVEGDSFSSHVDDLDDLIKPLRLLGKH